MEIFLLKRDQIFYTSNIAFYDWNCYARFISHPHPHPHSFHSTKSNIYKCDFLWKVCPRENPFPQFWHFPDIVQVPFVDSVESKKNLLLGRIRNILYSKVKSRHYSLRDDPISKRNLILCILWKKKKKFTYSCVTLFSALY